MQFPNVLLNGSCGKSRPPKVVRKEIHSVGDIVYGSERDFVGHDAMQRLHDFGHSTTLFVSFNSISLSVTHASR